MKIPISGLIIAQNEEKSIEKAILNIKLNVGEIIIIDGGSTDNTVEICEKLGCKVFHREFDFNFSNQRNFGLSKCNEEWVLTLDADEWFSEDFFNILPALMMSDLSVVAALHIFRISRFDGEVRGEDFQWRLVNKNRCTWEGKVHEGLIFKNGYKGVKIPKEFLMWHEHSMGKQLWSNTLYYNVNKGINVRPKDNEGMEYHDGVWVNVETRRD